MRLCIWGENKEGTCQTMGHLYKLSLVRIVLSFIYADPFLLPSHRNRASILPVCVGYRVTKVLQRRELAQYSSDSLRMVANMVKYALLSTYMYLIWTLILMVDANALVAANNRPVSPGRKQKGRKVEI